MPPRRRKRSPDFGPRFRTSSRRMKDPAVVPFPELTRSRMVMFNPDLPPAAFPSLPLGPRPSTPEHKEQEKAATSDSEPENVAIMEKDESSAAYEEQQRGRKRKRDDALSSPQPTVARDTEVADDFLHAYSDSATEGDQTNPYWDDNAPGISDLTHGELAELSKHGGGDFHVSEGLQFSPSPEREALDSDASWSARLRSVDTESATAGNEAEGHDIAWRDIAPALQLEIFHNARKKFNEQRAVALLDLDMHNIEFLEKVVTERRRQIDFEEDLRRKALAKQLEILMNADNSKPEEAMSATEVLHDITEQQFAAVLQSNQVEFNIVSSAELKSATTFLEQKNLQLELAGHWSSSYPGEYELSGENSDDFLATFRAENLLQAVSDRKQNQPAQGNPSKTQPAPKNAAGSRKTSTLPGGSRVSSDAQAAGTPKLSLVPNMAPPSSMKSRKSRASQKIRPSPLKTELRRSASPVSDDRSADRTRDSPLLLTSRKSIPGTVARSRSSTAVSQGDYDIDSPARRLRSPKELRPSRAKLEMQASEALLHGVRGLDPSSSGLSQQPENLELLQGIPSKIVTLQLKPTLLREFGERKSSLKLKSTVFTGLSTSIKPHLSYGPSTASRSSLDPVQRGIESLWLDRPIPNSPDTLSSTRPSRYASFAGGSEASNGVGSRTPFQQPSPCSPVHRENSPSDSVVLPSIETDDGNQSTARQASSFRDMAHLLTPATSPSKRGTIEKGGSEYSPSERSDAENDQIAAPDTNQSGGPFATGKDASIPAMKEAKKGYKSSSVKASAKGVAERSNIIATPAKKPESNPSTLKKRKNKNKSASAAKRVSTDIAKASSATVETEVEEAHTRAEAAHGSNMSNINDAIAVSSAAQTQPGPSSASSRTPSAQFKPKPKRRRGRPRKNQS